MTDHPMKPEDRALIELRPCPFCGGPPVERKTMYGRPVLRWVTCESCECSASAYSKASDARSAWNRRTEARASGEVFDPATYRGPWHIKHHVAAGHRAKVEVAAGGKSCVMLGGIQLRCWGEDKTNDETWCHAYNRALDHADAALSLPREALVDELEGVISDLESSGWARAPGCIRTLKRVASSLVGRDEAALPDLTDPQVVHLNMLRGGIAKLTPAQIGHMYRGEQAREVVAEVKRQNADAFADRVPLDKEGGVDA